MMFITGIFEYPTAKSHRPHIQTEAEYFAKDRDKLKQFRCPICKEHEMFRGGLFLGCTGCFNFFDEKDVIQENLTR